MTLRLYNTMTRSVEPFVTLDAGRVSLYTCGPTVYNYAHIGNFRTFVCVDVLRRTLRHLLGFTVKQVVNFTDVDDRTIAGAQAFDDTKYPDLKGQWRAIGGPMRFDGSKPWGPGQEAPLTPEYQAIFEANLADQAAGGQGYDRDFVCLSPGMPRVTNGYGEMEFVITPDTTHVLIQHIHDNRRIFTDGRDWPRDL